MTRRFVILLSLFLCGAVGPATAQSASETQTPPRGTQFVYVNTQAILPQVPGAKEAQQTFNQEIAGYNQEVQSLRNEVDSLLTAYRQQESTLTAQAKEQRQQEIIQKQQQLQQRASTLEQKANQRQQELLKPILDRVTGVIDSIRDENDYTVVFDVSASGVVAADPQLDITQLVLERLKAGGGDTTTTRPGR